MKRTIIDVCAMTSFVIVVMLGVIEKEVIKQIKFMMPSSTGTVVK